MPSRRKTDKPITGDTLSFEDSLSKLEDIVESMESELLPLEDLVSQYEAGSALLKHCDSVLSAARKRIELITLSNHDRKDSDNLPAPTTPNGNSGADEDDNDISLF